MGTKIEKCMNCENPARYVNHTQFAGTHYWCDHCVPAEDKSECTEIKTCANPYCDCAPHDCLNNKVDTRDYWSHMSNAKVKSLQRDTAETTATALHKAIKTMNQQYLLDKLQEEAAEIIQAVSKIRRFGPTNHHPDRTTTNLQELVGELEDFQAIVWALEEIQYLDPKPSTTATIKKYQQLTSS